MSRNKYKLIDTAIDLMRQKGYSQVSVDEILARSGVQKSNFYYHFKTKEACAMAAIERMLELMDERIWQEILGDKSLSPKERLEKLFDFLAQAFEKDSGKIGDPFGNLAAELADHNQKFQQKLNDYFIRYASYIEGVIDEGIEEEEFSRSYIPREVAEAILAQMQGAYLLARAYQDVNAFRRNVEFLLNAIST